MTFEIKSEPHKVLSRRITVAMAVAAALLGMLVLYRANHYPRTDDAEVFANFIGIAPQVDGPILRLNVHDNQFVRKGELLFEIDERPYQYALERATSDQGLSKAKLQTSSGESRPWLARSRGRRRMYTAPKPTQHDGQPLSMRHAPTYPTRNRASPGQRRNGLMRLTIYIALSRF